MKLSLLFIFYFYAFTTSGVFKTFQTKSVKVSDLFDIKSITDVELENTYTTKKWHLSKNNLLKLKNILEESTALKNILIVKPGRLYITIYFSHHTKRYFYCYPNGIYNDSQDYTSTTNFPFSISLAQRFDWEAFI